MPIPRGPIRSVYRSAMRATGWRGGKGGVGSMTKKGVADPLGLREAHTRGRRRVIGGGIATGGAMLMGSRNNSSSGRRGRPSAKSSGGRGF